MQFKAILLSACAAALATAQSTVLTFTKVPTPVIAGESTTLSYATNDTSLPISIILRKGDANNLQTVATLTDDATGGEYIWTPSKDLATGSDYALEIKQGSQVNYFGPFSIQGGSSQSPSEYSSASSAWATSSDRTGTSSTYSTTSSVYSTTSSAQTTTSSVHAITPSVSAYPIYSANSTSTFLGTGSSYGTASTIARNTTLSSATLSATHNSSATFTTATPTTSGTGFSSASASTSAKPTNAASGLKAGSSIALFIGAAVAVLYA